MFPKRLIAKEVQNPMKITGIFFGQNMRSTQCQNSLEMSGRYPKCTKNPSVFFWQLAKVISLPIEGAKKYKSHQRKGAPV